MRRPAREINVPLLYIGGENGEFAVWHADCLNFFSNGLHFVQFRETPTALPHSWGALNSFRVSLPLELHDVPVEPFLSVCYHVASYVEFAGDGLALNNPGA